MTRLLELELELDWCYPPIIAHRTQPIHEIIQHIHYCPFKILIKRYSTVHTPKKNDRRNNNIGSAGIK